MPHNYGICPVCHLRVRCNSRTENGLTITSRHSPVLNSEGMSYGELCEGQHQKFLDTNDLEGVECPHCGGFNYHSECGTYEVLNPECKHCGECTETQ